MHNQRNWRDTAFGVATLALAISVFASFGTVNFGPSGRWNAWAYPAVIAGLLGVVSVALLLRGLFFYQGQVPRLRLRYIIIGITICLALSAALVAAFQRPGITIAMRFGPSEYATMLICVLTIAIAVTGMSRLRAVTMVLVGLLLAVVGTDIDTGAERLTLGITDLTDGIDGTVLCLGLLMVADGLLCLASPACLLKSYAQWIGGVFDRYASVPIGSMPVGIGIGMRCVAVVVIGAASYAAFITNNGVWDVGCLFVFGLLGIGCKWVGANRLVLVLAFYSGVLLEQNVRRAVLIASGDPMIFLRIPYSAGFVALSCGILFAAGAVSIRRRVRLQTGA
jgi:TctA family transporter